MASECSRDCHSGKRKRHSHKQRQAGTAEGLVRARIRMAEPAGCTDSKSSEHRQQTPGDKSASAGPVFVPNCSQHDRSLPGSWIHPEPKSYKTGLREDTLKSSIEARG